MRLPQFLLFAIMFVTFASCKKDDTNITNTTQTIYNVSYGTDARQNMDVYLPVNRSTATTKVMVLIHGGGWSSGDKTDFNGFVAAVKTSFPDYAIFNINYRLSDGTYNLFPTQENDVKAAMQFIYDKSAEYIISNKYVLLGASAGGHLAMLQGYKYSTPVKPKAIVSFFGPSDLTDMYNNPVGNNPLLSLALAQAIGATPSSNAALYTNSSPINFIDNLSPPTILFHGSEDPLVKPSQSENVKIKLLTMGVASQYVLYAGKGHGDDWGDAGYADAFSKMALFLSANVQ